MSAAVAQEAPSDRISGDGLLHEIVTLIRRYVVLKSEEADAIGLWVLHTWAIDAAHFTPYLSITSATSESGKSTLLRVLERLVQRPWKTGRVTPAVLARKIDSERPTLLLDETDAAFSSSRGYAEALRGVLNEGFTRGGVYSVVAGDSYRDFAVFGPKAIAGIGKLPDTIASRAIYVRLRRRKDEPVATLEPWALEELAAPLRLQAKEWVTPRLCVLERSSVQLPAALTDRGRDAWKPLAAIATVAGGEWPRRAAQAAVRLSKRRREQEDVDETRVLAVIREAFERNDAEQLPTVELAKELAAAGLLDGERVSRGEQAAGYAVRRALTRFEVGPAHQFRHGLRVVRGYKRAQFDDAWERYL